MKIIKADRFGSPLMAMPYHDFFYTGCSFAF